MQRIRSGGGELGARSRGATRRHRRGDDAGLPAGLRGNAGSPQRQTEELIRRGGTGRDVEGRDA